MWHYRTAAAGPPYNVNKISLWQPVHCDRSALSDGRADKADTVASLPAGTDWGTYLLCLKFRHFFLSALSLVYPQGYSSSTANRDLVSITSQQNHEKSGALAQSSLTEW